MASGLMYANSPKAQQLLLQTNTLLKSSSESSSSSNIAALSFSLRSEMSVSMRYAMKWSGNIGSTSMKLARASCTTTK